MTKVSLIAIELKSSRGTFSSIAIELKLTDNAPLVYNDCNHKAIFPATENADHELQSDGASKC